VLRDQQMPCAGDGKKFGDAFDDSQQDDLKQIFHAPPVVRRLVPRIILADSRMLKSTFRTSRVPAVAVGGNAAYKGYR
jgi:hypothetical protein